MISNVLMIVAVLLAPFIAVFAQRQIDIMRERRQRKLWVFKTLMATRARPVSSDHVEALNMIELEFTDKREEPVLAAWREYRDHLNSYPRDGDDHQALVTVWGQKAQDLVASLLERMGRCLAYKLDVVQIKKGAYSPEGPAVAELEQQLLRQRVLEWLSGDRRVLVCTVPTDDEAAKKTAEFADGVLALLKGDRRLKVDATVDQGEESGGAPPASTPQKPR